MAWSYRLGRFFGIDVRVHATFLLLIAWVAYQAHAAHGHWLAVLSSVVFVLMLFTFVVMHEYGHALTARRFGIRTRGITLYPIGGVAMLESMPKRPREQILVALAGPAVNFVLAGAIALLAYTLGHNVLTEAADPSGGLGALLGALFFVNVLMGAFNLLPALPMDGGRVLSAAISLRKGPLRAAEIAARVAKVVAILMAIYAYEQGQFMLGAIALFVWSASSAEVRAARQRARSGEYPVTEVMGRTPWEAQAPDAASSAQVGPTWVQDSRSSRSQPGGVIVEVVEGPSGPEVRVLRQR